MTPRYRVRTPENVEFEYTLGNLGSRLGAWIVDNVLVAGLVLVGLLVLATAQGLRLGDLEVGFLGGLLSFIGLLVVFAAQWGYFVVCEWWLGGQTPGKKLFGLRVLADDGVRITLYQSALRNLFRMADSFPVVAVAAMGHPLLHLFPLFILPGAVTALLSPASKRLGDLVAGTIVVEETRRQIPSAVVPPRERYNQFIDDPLVADVLHRQLHPGDADTLVTLCLRREELALEARLALFARAAEHLEERLGLQRPAHFSDEKYVLNLVAVLLGRDEALRGRRAR